MAKVKLLVFFLIGVAVGFAVTYFMGLSQEVELSNKQGSDVTSTTIGSPNLLDKLSGFYPHLLAGTSDGLLYLNKETPELIWVDRSTGAEKLRLPALKVAHPNQGPQRVEEVVNTTSSRTIYYDRGRIYATENRRTMWEFNLSEWLVLSETAPVLYGDVIFIHTYNGLALGSGCEEGNCEAWAKAAGESAYVYGLDVNTGQVRKKFLAEGPASFLTIYKDKLIFDGQNDWGQTITIVDIATNKTVWKTSIGWMANLEYLLK